ncbi:MAG: hypothetical protein KDH20_14965 [Rhodocyclaceae bacterium]|nr:hypothetical protein [Rhodocyclaceae bacterium]
MVRAVPVVLAWALLAAASLSPAFAQQVFEDEQRVGAETPEGWAMSFMTASTLLTGIGGLPALAPGRIALAAELATIPRLSDAQRQVGFAGEKAEDLNKSPLFGRLRAWIGLPAGLVGEVAYTPDIEVNDVRAKRLFALAVGRGFHATPDLQVSVRGFIQRGRARGDITCPAGLAGNPDPAENPFGCAARSEDELRLNYVGADLGLSWQPEPEGLGVHLGAGVARLSPSVQVHAPLLGDALDRSRLYTRRYVRYFSVGLGSHIQRNVDWQAQVLYVPLEVARGGASRDNDAYWSLRLLLRWRPALLN